MKKAFLPLILVVAVLASLVGCDLLKGILGGYMVSGTISFSSAARSVDGIIVVRLQSTIAADYSGIVAKENTRQYGWQDSLLFAFEKVTPGEYCIVVFIDANGSGAWDAGEPVGGYPIDANGAPVLAAVDRDTTVDVTVWKNGPPVAGLPVSVVYDATNPSDVSLAAQIRTVLTTNLPFTAPGVTGSMPHFTVTLVPQNTVPSIYDPFYIMPGGAAPVIVTPGITMHSDEPWCHNIANQLRGVIAMGGGGSHFLETVSMNWPVWGYLDQRPNEIRWFVSWNNSADTVETRNVPMAWNNPLASPAIPGADFMPVQVGSGVLDTVEANKAGGAPPLDGEWYAARVGDPSHFPIGRQGRFLLFGFAGIPGRPETGHVLFVNLVKLMSAY
ncbi:MAG: hypothetical protein NT005_02315 [Spirochaetes bacterium]|nr:hypothetical protein [Spirochaetota bacterium]